MIFFYSVMIYLFLKPRSSCTQCLNVVLDDFSINVPEQIEVEAGDCIWIQYNFTFPTNKVKIPVTMVLFKGDPQNTVEEKVFKKVLCRKGCFKVNGLPSGEHEYGFKLKWDDNQTYIFPKRVRVSVSALTTRPAVRSYPMIEGNFETLLCRVDRLCFSRRPHVHWEWTKADGQTVTRYGGNVLRGDVSYDEEYDLTLFPIADDHNTNITCVADYGVEVVRTTVTLTVLFPPKFLKGSRCIAEGGMLTCVCISLGNPLAPITWPSYSFTDFSVTSSSSVQTVISTIVMPAANHTTVKCTSSNEVGRRALEIPVQNSTDSYQPDRTQKGDGVVPWIIAGFSLSLNMVLLISLIIYTHKGKCWQKQRCEETNTYMSLNMANVEQIYSIISPQQQQQQRR